MKKLIAIFVLAGLLSGCGQQETQHQGIVKAQEPEMIDVKVETEPEAININNNITIKAIVTQGREKVDDADEVRFEVWKAGQETREMIKGKKEGHGTYSAKINFTEAGQYTVVTHVTARRLHIMPQIDITVGDRKK